MNEEQTCQCCGCEQKNNLFTDEGDGPYCSDCYFELCCGDGE